MTNKNIQGVKNIKLVLSNQYIKVCFAQVITSL